jgi:hypothetical protein
MVFSMTIVETSGLEISSRLAGRVANGFNVLVQQLLTVPKHYDVLILWIGNYYLCNVTGPIRPDSTNGEFLLK